MPAPVSRKQYRYIMAILHGKGGHSSRGDRMPKSVAGKYAGSGVKPNDLPESKGKESEGGRWDEEKHAKDKKHVDEKRTERKKHKASLRKSFEEVYKGQGVGVVVVNPNGHILLGQDSHTGKWCTPGGHVDSNESFEDAARRELKEEAGIGAKSIREIGQGKWEGNSSKVFVVESFSGLPGNKTDGELKNISFKSPADIPWANMRGCSRDGLEIYLNGKLNKSVSDLLSLEELQKNIMRRQVGSDVTFEMTHADSLKLVGSGTFKFLRKITADMQDEGFKTVKFDTYSIAIRKHANDVYSGRIEDGHKLIHQWTNKSLPGVAAELMSVFEWYSPADEQMLNEMSESDFDDDSLDGGLQALTDNYKKHNIANIYSEMEHIREEIRNGGAVDLQQVEQRVMKLFDKLESNLMRIVDQHNKLAHDAGSEIDELHTKLLELQSKIDGLSKKPTKVEAVSTSLANPERVHHDEYPYLPKPQVVIEPNGKIVISFGAEWTPMEQENFLKDIKAKALKKSKR